MVSNVILECKARKISTGAFLRNLRRQGMVPGVVYGKDHNTTSVMVVSKDLKALLHGHGGHGLYTLSIEGEKQPVLALLRDIQKHPVSGMLVHVDFMRVSLGEKISSAVSVVLHGEEEVTKNGGVVQAGIKEVEVECLPGYLPDILQLDISKLVIGDKRTVEDLPHPPEVEILTDAGAMVVNILPPAKPLDEKVEAEGEDTEKKAE